MVTGHVFIATSLDGFIARDDGDIGWLVNRPTEGEDYGYDDFIDSVDGLIMGRASYEKVLTFETWPYPKTVIVLSRTLSNGDVREDLADKVRIIDAAPKEVMQDLSEEGWRRAYVDGGRVIQAFLRDGLIADMIITQVPVLLGSGIPLFGALDRDVELRHVETTAFPTGLVQSKYEVAETA